MAAMPQASSVYAAYASISAFIMLFQTMFNQILPRPVRNYLLDIFHRLFVPRLNHATIVVEELDGMSPNQIYTAVETYLCTRTRTTISRLKISKLHKDSTINVKFAKTETIPDHFEGIELNWKFVKVDREKKKTDDEGDEEKRSFELFFDKKYKDKVLDSYVPFVLETAKSITDNRKIISLHTLSGIFTSWSSTSVVWDSVHLDHPSTFETLAMDPGLKKSIIEDLDRFVKRKDFYRKAGRAWKRGYLLYGPPGTGKSSLIAAMANHLKFDIYDLELGNVKRDSDLRKLLMRTANRSILVIEDIDCTVKLPDRNGGATNGEKEEEKNDSHSPQFTLSGLLNFIDGLWSSCGDQRIIIFTTNNKSKLDPALLRPGRMDMHIHMSYLTPDGFKVLASTYLDKFDSQHPALLEIEDLIANLNIEPAKVAGELMKGNDADESLLGLLDFLRRKMKKKMKANEGGQVVPGGGDEEGEGATDSEDAKRVGDGDEEGKEDNKVDQSETEVVACE